MQPLDNGRSRVFLEIATLDCYNLPHIGVSQGAPAWKNLQTPRGTKARGFCFGGSGRDDVGVLHPAASG